MTLEFSSDERKDEHFWMCDLLKTRADEYGSFVNGTNRQFSSIERKEVTFLDARSPK
jgi:hypothetical protein